MNLQIFDVEHGACSLLTCDNNARLMLDAGHNGSTGWRPGSYIRSLGIGSLEMLVVTNYDEDHVSGIGDLLDNVHVQWLSRNPTVATTTMRSLKSESGMGPGIDRLCSAIDYVFNGGLGTGAATQPYFAGLSRLEFFCSYPQFQDENNLSFVNYLNCNGVGFLFPGDLEKAGWQQLAKNPDFVWAMSTTNVLVAPHHGRMADANRQFFAEFYRAYFPNVFYVVISDKGYMYDTQQTVPIFRAFSKGGPFRGETRQVLTTRNDGLIGFNLQNGSWGPY